MTVTTAPPPSGGPSSGSTGAALSESRRQRRRRDRLAARDSEIPVELYGLPRGTVALLTTLGSTMPQIELMRCALA